MGNAMVTGRMSGEKKQAGNAILNKLDVTPSAAINMLYDYIIKNKKLPFEDNSSKEDSNFLQNKFDQAEKFLNGIPLANNKFSNLSVEEIKDLRITELLGE